MRWCHRIAGNGTRLRAVDKGVWRAIDVKWWHVPAVLSIVLIGTYLIVGAVRDGGGSQQQFTKDEEKLRAELKALLPALVVKEEEVAGLMGDFYECTDPGMTADFFYSRGGDGDVRNVTVREGSNETRVDADFCEDGMHAWVGSVVELPRTKADEIYINEVYRELSDRDPRELERLAEAKALEVTGDPVPASKPRWLEVGGLGDGYYAVSFAAEDRRFDMPFNFYVFSFSRGPVWAALSVRFSPEAGSEDEAIDIAHRFDVKIRQQIELLSAALSK